MKIDKKEVLHQLNTVRDYVRWGASRFTEAKLTFGHGTDNAWDEALYLVFYVLNLPLDSNPDVMNATLTFAEREQVIELLSKRVTEHKPAPYLTHQAWFAGMPFYVDERVIIPRSPIAELIEEDFSPWLTTDAVHNILDLCTGSGCIAIACALAFPESHVDAVDISADALEIAKMNVDEYRLADRVTLIESDLFENITAKKYDIIVSNPPYVDADEMAALPKEFKHEPELALASGQDGLDITYRILQQASQYLSDDGLLVVEVGASAEALKKHYADTAFTWLEFARGGEGVFLLTADQLKTIKG